MSINKALYKAVTDCRASMLKDLEQFVNIDSPSGYETGMLEFQGLVIERMKAMGANITTKKVVSPMAGYNVKAVWQGALNCCASHLLAGGNLGRHCFPLQRTRRFR